MANNSAKKNQQNIRLPINILTITIYALIAWMITFNSFYLISESISIWHWILSAAISTLSYFCMKQIVKCWELQLPAQATQYYYDFLALNSIVQLVDPFTHFIWNVYWLIVVWVLWQGAKWLWDYITPRYEQVEEQGGDKNDKKRQKKQKKDKRQKIKYI